MIDWAEYLRAEIESLGNFVYNAEREYRNAKIEAENRVPRFFEQEIEGNIGTVRVNYFGFLVGVELTATNLRSYRGNVLADRIVRSVALAAKDAARARERHNES
ncbi:hypothetical protein [Actinomadura rupiterrae]|uniref:hypothetical protein n=1 Tax=Actinomadura rupiterrae TaxID=559627 RepID=UPI0020A599A8|nr:hypothetical protein [Actinomadura rupiterrae]MCP2337345.1 hypothetical protein [Actinomadura rupiterrae]